MSLSQALRRTNFFFEVRAIPTTARYLEIADELRQAIVDGILRPGSKLRSAAQLAEEYGVVPATARQATDILLREGLLDSRPGAGLFVRLEPEVIRMVRSWYQNPGTGSPWRAAMAVGLSGLRHCRFVLDRRTDP